MLKARVQSQTPAPITTDAPAPQKAESQANPPPQGLASLRLTTERKAEIILDYLQDRLRRASKTALKEPLPPLRHMATFEACGANASLDQASADRIASWIMRHERCLALIKNPALRKRADRIVSRYNTLQEKQRKKEAFAEGDTPNRIYRLYQRGFSSLVASGSKEEQEGQSEIR